MPRPRRNPTLITLCNPPAAPAAWQRFHGKGPHDAAMYVLPDIAGVPRNPWALGFCVGLDTDGQAVRWRWTYDDGPWLVGGPDPHGLWIISRHGAQLERLRAGATNVSHVIYYPSRTSGKYVAGSPYAHEFGEGGRLPRGRWPEVYPNLRRLAPNAYRFDRPRGGFVVEPRGIVG